MFFADNENFYLNGKKQKRLETRRLSEALIFLNINQSNWKEEREVLVGLIESLSPPVSRRVHILESANLELAYVASGRVDAYINLSDKVWDISAGEHLVRKAGGKAKIMNDYENELLARKGIIAASSNELLSELINNLKNHKNLLNFMSHV